MQGGVVPPRPLGIQDVLMQLVQGGGAAAAGADADADTSHGDGNDAAVQPPAETPEDRERVLEQLFEHFRDAFGGENCARTNVRYGFHGARELSARPAACIIIGDARCRHRRQLGFGRKACHGWRRGMQRTLVAYQQRPIMMHCGM